MRTRYVYDAACGKVVELPQREGPPLPGRAPMVISDTQAPFRSMASGQVFDSKSAYRADLRARGFREVGNDVPSHRDARDYAPAQVERDIADSIGMIEADHPEASTSTGAEHTRAPEGFEP